MRATVPGAWLISTVAVFELLLLEPVVVLGMAGVVVPVVVGVAAEVVGVEVVMVVVLGVVGMVVVVGVVEVIETGATGCVNCADGANCWDGRCSGTLGIAFGDVKPGDDGGGGVVVERINVCSRTCDWSRSKSFLTGRSLPLLPI